MLKYDDHFKNDSTTSKAFEAPAIPFEKELPEMKLKTLAEDESLFRVCDACDVPMVKLYNEYNLSCPKCSKTYFLGNTGEYTIGVGEHHNTSNNAHMPFKPVSRDRKFHYAMVKCTSNYEVIRSSNIHSKIKRHNYMNREFKLPANVLQEAGELFIQLQEYDSVHRGGCRAGLIGACISVKCQEAKISKTSTQIASMMGVEETDIHFGLNELQKYHNMGVIKIPQNSDPSSDYVDSLFEAFSADEKYKPFVLSLLKRIARNNIPDIDSCQIPTKCIGSFYVLNLFVKMGITHEQIASKCENISRGTYLNILNAIVKNEKIFRKTFKKYGIPMPESWPKV